MWSKHFTSNFGALVGKNQEMYVIPGKKFPGKKIFFRKIYLRKIFLPKIFPKIFSPKDVSPKVSNFINISRAAPQSRLKNLNHTYFLIFANKGSKIRHKIF